MFITFKNLNVSCGFQTHYVANPLATYMGEVRFPNWGRIDIKAFIYNAFWVWSINNFKFF